MRSTSTLLLRRSMGNALAEDYIDWATECLTQGQDSPSLRVLAGLHPRWERHEVEQYFQGTCRELGIAAIPADAPPRETARLVQEVYRGGKISADEAVRMMADLYTRSAYSDPVLSIWFEIEEELSLQGSGHEGCFYSPELLEHLEETVEREFALFSQAVALPLPPGFNRFIRCSRCSAIGPPKLKHRSATDAIKAGIRGAWAKPALWATCEHCGSFDYRGISDPDVREDYFLRLESAQLEDRSQDR